MTDTTTTDLAALADKWQDEADMHMTHAKDVADTDPIESGIFKASSVTQLSCADELRALASRAVVPDSSFMGIAIIVDADMPPGTIELRRADGSVAARIQQAAPLPGAAGGETSRMKETR